MFICRPELFAAIDPATPDESTCVVLTGRPRTSAAPMVTIAVISATRASSTSSSSSVRARHMNRPFTWAGMMLAAWPPSSTIPCAWLPGRNCWRNAAMATCATVMASPALMPS